jgi:cupredoxin-like protein
VAALRFTRSSSEVHGNDQLCAPDDADGIIDEPANLQLTVTDTGFMPKIVTTQNTSTITLKLQNEGSRPHSFVVDCKPTPNTDGCPMKSCFSAAAAIEPVEPGAEVTVSFQTPLVEGIYNFHSDVPEDAELEAGQFIIQ